MKNRKRRSAAVLAAGMSVLLGAGTIDRCHGADRCR